MSAARSHLDLSLRCFFGGEVISKLEPFIRYTLPRFLSSFLQLYYIRPQDPIISTYMTSQMKAPTIIEVVLCGGALRLYALVCSVVHLFVANARSKYTAGLSWSGCSFLGRCGGFCQLNPKPLAQTLNPHILPKAGFIHACPPDSIEAMIPILYSPNISLHNEIHSTKP